MDCAEALELILDRELLSETELLSGTELPAERERLPAGETGSAFDERKLAPRRRLALEAHLRTCANCTAQSKGLDRALAALRAGSAAGHALAGTGSSTGEALDLWPGQRATLAAEGRFVTPSEPQPVKVEPAPALQRARWRWTRVASFASAAAVLALALPLLWKQDGRPGTGPNVPATGSSAPVALGAGASNSGGSNSGAATSDAAPLEPSSASSTPELEPQLAADVPAPADPSAAATDVAGKGGLRHALGEKRRREFATPFDASGESGGWSLASDRELR